MRMEIYVYIVYNINVLNFDNGGFTMWFYKGYFIVRDLCGDGFDVRSCSGEFIEVGCASVASAKNAIDDYLLMEE